MSDNVRRLRTARDTLHKLEDRGIVENNLTMKQITAIRIAEFAIDEICSTDVQPVKRGRWIEHHDLIECNVCGFEVKDTYCEKRDMTSSETSYDYCPKCGADMREPEAIKG